MNKNKLVHIIIKLKRISEARHFFNNGGCSKLAEFLSKESSLPIHEKSLLLKIRTKYIKQKEEMLKDFMIFSPFDFIKYYDQIDHISYIQEKTIFDLNGIKTLPNIKELNKEKNYFYCLFNFSKEKEYYTFLEKVAEKHTYGKYDYYQIKNKINAWINLNNTHN